MTPITFVCWKWKPPVGYRSQFEAEHVVVLKSMIARHYHKPHRFVCVTDDATELNGIETIPLWSEWGNIPNPNGSHNPSCYRRLKMFAPDAGQTFGERVVSMDLDMVIVNDITPLFDRPEDFVIWGQTDYPKTQWYNGSLWMLKTGTRTEVWSKFNPRLSPLWQRRAGKKGSDQGWLSYVMGPKEATWGTKDGVYSFRVHLSKDGYALPEDARVVVFHGKTDPWAYRAQQIDWVKRHWC